MVEGGYRTNLICLSVSSLLMELVLSSLTLLDLVSQQHETIPHESGPARENQDKQHLACFFFDYFSMRNMVLLFPVFVFLCYHIEGNRCRIFFAYNTSVFSFKHEGSAARRVYERSERNMHIWEVATKKNIIELLHFQNCCWHFLSVFTVQNFVYSFWWKVRS